MHPLGQTLAWVPLLPFAPLQELVRFFFEVDFTDKEVLDRLPKSLQSDPAACARVCKMVRCCSGENALPPFQAAPPFGRLKYS